MPFHLSVRAVVAMIVFATVSILIGARLAAAGGWRSLAERYPAPQSSPAEVERYRFCSLRMAGGPVGGATYESCVTIGLGEAGILLALWAPFRLFHPPLRIPWSAVETCTAQELSWGRSVRVGLRGGGSFQAYGNAADAILRWWTERGFAA
ncbi:MAG: hypothetical protein ACREMG_08815 [Gemmatimonadales bacterium]